MNAKLSHCISKLLVLGAFISAQTISAQNLWEEGVNIAGESAGAEEGQSAEAFIGGRFTSGEFRTPGQAKTLWGAEAQASAVTSAKDLYLKGNFGFGLEYGTQMCGSMFTEPGYFPIDVLEFTPGDKLRQTYDIGGGFAWKNSSRWTPGANVRFRGVNYAKRKDLRHTTYRQEFEFSPSVAYSGDGWMAGATYTIGKVSEFITAEVVGADKGETYFAFLDKGLRYGTLQAWDSDGIHLKGDGVDRLPVKEIIHSAAIQASFGSTLYADAAFTFKSGEVGEKGYVWFRYPARALDAKLILAIPSGSATHYLRADYHWHALENYAVVLDKVPRGGVVTPVQYGTNRVFRHRTLEAGPSYTIEHRKGWSAGASLSIEHTRDLTTVMYPYHDHDQATHMHVGATGSIPFWRFTAAVALDFSALIGSHRHYLDKEDGTTGVVSLPTRLTDWREMEEEADDATKFAFGATLRYNIGLGMYVQAGCTWLHAFGITLLPGCDRQTSYIRFGYNF